MAGPGRRSVGAVRSGGISFPSSFILATHSPILMACPDAEILSFDHLPIRPVPFCDLEHVKFTRDFLNQPEAFLRHL